MAQRGYCTVFTHILLFCVVYLSLILVVKRVAAGDPTSVFFDASHVYEARYSADRAKQADAFIKSAWLRSKTASIPVSSTAAPTLCLGIKSTTHERARSLRTTIGSLLQGLDREERNEVHLKVLIAHVDPLAHPAVHEPWLPNTVDDVLFYNATFGREEMEWMTELEVNQNGKLEVEQEKEVFDYTYLLKQCYETSSEYIGIVEDDMVAVDGWLQRSLEALGEVEEKTAVSGRWDGWLYLRLFFAEKSLGWSSEDWSRHTFWSMFGIGFLAATLYALRIWKPHSAVGRNITPYSGIWICVVILPLSIILYFATGRLTMYPLRNGIFMMNQHGCCSQGLVLPRYQAGNLLAWFQEDRRIGFVDALVEEYADQNDLLRWAVVPSLLQHAGRKNSGGDDVDVHLSETAWNLGFEDFDAQELKKEHERDREDPGGSTRQDPN